MTRETKIGLLVGLAFIIVIGILLSDHLTSSTEPPPAPLVVAGPSVRQTVTAPGGTQPPITPIVVAPQVTPSQQVPTQGDLDAQQTASAIVKVGGPAQTATPTAPITNQTQTPTAVVQNGSRPSAQQRPIQARTNNTQQNDLQVAGADAPSHPLADLAQQQGEPLTAVGGSGSGSSQAIQTSAHLEGNGATSDYVAQPGDNLSRIAATVMGSNTRANRDAIVRANASLQADPNKVIVGKTYKIPSAAQVATQQQIQSTPAPTPAVATPAAQSAPTGPAGAGEYWYTVREGDTLTRIVRDQLGQDGQAAIQSLVELNRDIIKDPNNLQINTRIRMPAKPLAQVN